MNNNNEYEAIIQSSFGITPEDFVQLKKKYHYIGEKLILDHVNGVNVVAKDLNQSAQKKEHGVSRLWDNLNGKTTKGQNQINQNLIAGSEATLKWLLDHDSHITRMDTRIKDVAIELYETQDKVKKFYDEFKDIKLDVEFLKQFKDEATKKLDNHEKRITTTEAQQHIDREIEKLGTFGLPVCLDLFTILDNIFSGEAGFYFWQERDEKARKERVDYLNNKLIKRVSNTDSYINYKQLADEVNELGSIDKKAIEFISSQYLSFSNNPNHEIADMLRIISTHNPDDAIKEIDSHSNIRTFLTLKDFVKTTTKELLAT